MIWYIDWFGFELNIWVIFEFEILQLEMEQAPCSSSSKRNWSVSTSRTRPGPSFACRTLPRCTRPPSLPPTSSPASTPSSSPWSRKPGRSKTKGSLPGYVRCLTNFKPRFVFRQWNRGSSWNRKLKTHLTDWARCQKANGGIYFTKKWRAETLQPCLEFDNLKPWFKSCIFKCISWLNGSFFGDDDQGFLKEGI